MRKNLGKLEASLRLGLGCFLFYFFILGGPLWTLAGLYLMLSGSFQFCALYYYLKNKAH